MKKLFFYLAVILAFAGIAHAPNPTENPLLFYNGIQVFTEESEPGLAALRDYDAQARANPRSSAALATRLKGLLDKVKIASTTPKTRTALINAGFPAGLFGTSDFYTVEARRLLLEGHLNKFAEQEAPQFPSAPRTRAVRALTSHEAVAQFHPALKDNVEAPGETDFLNDSYSKKFTQTTRSASTPRKPTPKPTPASQEPVHAKVTAGDIALRPQPLSYSPPFAGTLHTVPNEPFDSSLSPVPHARSPSPARRPAREDATTELFRLQTKLLRTQERAAQLEGLLEQQDTTSAKYAAMEQQLQGLRAQQEDLEGVKRELATSRLREALYTQQLATLEAEAQESTSTSQGLTSDLADAQRALAAERQTSARLRQEAATVLAQAQKLQSQQQSLALQTEAAKQAEEQHNAELAKLKQQLAGMVSQDQLTQAEQDAAAAAAKAAQTETSLRATLAQNQAQISKLASAQEQAAKERERLRATSAESANSTAEKNRQIEEQEKQLSELNAELARQKKATKELRSQAEEFEQQRKQFESERASLEARLADSTRRAAELEAQTQSFPEERASLERQLAAAKSARPTKSSSLRREAVLPSPAVEPLPAQDDANLRQARDAHARAQSELMQQIKQLTDELQQATEVARSAQFASAATRNRRRKKTATHVRRSPIKERVVGESKESESPLSDESEYSNASTVTSPPSGRLATKRGQETRFLNPPPLASTRENASAPVDSPVAATAPKSKSSLSFGGNTSSVTLGPRFEITNDVTNITIEPTAQKTPPPPPPRAPRAPKRSLPSLRVDTSLPSSSESSASSFGSAATSVDSPAPLTTPSRVSFAPSPVRTPTRIPSFLKPPTPKAASTVRSFIDPAVFKKAREEAAAFIARQKLQQAASASQADSASQATSASQTTSTSQAPSRTTQDHIDALKHETERLTAERKKIKSPQRKQGFAALGNDFQALLRAARTPQPQPLLRAQRAIRAP